MKLTQEKLAILKEGAKRDLAIGALARKLGVTRPTVRRWARNAGITLRIGHYIRTDKGKAYLRQLWEEGLTQIQICKRMCVCEVTLRRILREEGLIPEARKAPAWVLAPLTLVVESLDTLQVEHNQCISKEVAQAIAKQISILREMLGTTDAGEPC